MKDLVFSIKNIFSTNINDGCLGQYEAKKYHIPAYQRGFKWASKKPTDAIQVLMNDLWDAFESSKNSNRKEYYMQYITVKKIVAENHLEVIDGQQRLTSFSILLSVLHSIIEDDTSLVNGKLEYAIREDFFNQYIYDRDKLKSFLLEEWDRAAGISIEGKAINSQDVFYLHSAAKYINGFCDTHILKTESKEGSNFDLSELKAFNEFVLNYVKLIVNEIEPHIDSERVFRNLNSNKVGLTEAELIKGLLLTKAARVNSEQIKQKHYREILEIRTALGRQWDEIMTWVNDEKVKHFFFSIKNKSVSEKEFNDIISKVFNNLKEPIKEEKALLLLLLSMTFNKDIEIKDNKFLLFNYFHKKTKENNSSLELLIKLKEIYAILKDRYNYDETYNLLGYLFFVEQSKVDKIDYLSEILYLPENEVVSELIKDRNNLIPSDIDVLKYGNEYNKQIHRVLLAINVFETARDKAEIRFDFYNFRKNNSWSLEHIFPQRPEGQWRGKVHVLTEDEKQEILRMIGDDYENINEVKRVLNKQKRIEEEKAIYYNALQKTWVNNIGNMSLLALPDNSSNGCAMFKLKRENVNEMVQSGRFMPRHTFEIFNKINVKSDSLSNWTNDDSVKNYKYIKSTITKLKSDSQL
jgi:uncharacterized protein with ParB-like and HNH nuclease domain